MKTKHTFYVKKDSSNWVWVDGKDIFHRPSDERLTSMALLPQTNSLYAIFADIAEKGKTKRVTITIEEANG